MMYFRAGEMAERFNAAVLKTVEGETSGGSNPSFSAKKESFVVIDKGFFSFWRFSFWGVREFY